MANLQFLGAAGTVSGSRHFLATDNAKILLDCGFFQGLKELRERNWREFPFQTSELDAVVLSHGHLDHCGGLALLARRGYDGPIFCTPGTADLAAIILRDSAYLEEEHAARANRKGYSRHKPAKPLFTMEDAETAISCLVEVPYHQVFAPANGLEVEFANAGHILGSAFVNVTIGGAHRLVFSGDLGRWDRPILKDPEFPGVADTVIMESTYGNRDHEGDPDSMLEEIIRDAAARGGVVLIPAFAIGRTQEVVYRIRELEDAGRIPILPVFVDSPMAIDVSRLYQQHADEHDLDTRKISRSGDHPLRTTQFRLTRTVDESKEVNERHGPMIIISASGMATGGRILHHLKRRLGSHANTVVLIGFQAVGTRGRALQDGAEKIKIHGEYWAVNAKVQTVDGMSAHADRGELIRWLRGMERAPRAIHLVHGEPEAASALAQLIADQLGWPARPAVDLEKVELI